MVKLHPNDLVAIVAVTEDIGAGIVAILMGITILGIIIMVVGIATVIAFDWWEDRFYRNGSTIGWLDYMHMRDLMAHGQNYEAVVFVLRKAYKMTEQEIQRMSPEDMDRMLQKLKIKQSGE